MVDLMVQPSPGHGGILLEQSHSLFSGNYFEIVLAGHGVMFAALFVEPHPGPLILDKHHMSDFIGRSRRLRNCAPERSPNSRRLAGGQL